MLAILVLKLFLCSPVKCSILDLYDTYEVSKLSNEIGSVAPDLATLRDGTWKGATVCYQLLLQTSGHSATLQHAYGDSVFPKAQVFRWFKAFSDGRESIDDELRSGRPSSSRTDENVDRIRDLVHQISTIGPGENQFWVPKNAETKTAAIGTFFPVPQSAGSFLWDLHLVASFALTLAAEISSYYYQLQEKSREKKFRREELKLATVVKWSFE
ncbi:hypothetical protein NQ318_009067 [Aromia moschata]|uniref:Mos1 transposase HTH domain-containing protein n=1 Tax=Aromia moschata TaxID=1265417 RepID=A0AAV8YWM7_9CUCU|nr:hypothetical protein NQ318_009067 [Aromia moschata]